MSLNHDAAHAPSSLVALTDYAEPHLTFQAGRYGVARVRQLEPHANSAACRVEHLIDNRHHRLVHATHRLFRINLRRHPYPDSTKLLQGDVDLNVQRIDFRDGDEVSLVKRILAGTERPRHHHTVDRTADDALIQDFAGTHN